MKKSNRLMAILLAVAMVITYMPALAFAEPAGDGADEGQSTGVVQEEGTEAGDGVTENVTGTDECGEGEDPAGEDGVEAEGSGNRGVGDPDEGSNEPGGDEEPVELSALFLDGVEIGGGDNQTWARFYAVDGTEDAISYSDLRIDVKGSDGSVVDISKCEAEVKRTWWDEAFGKDRYELINSSSYGVAEEDRTSDKGFTEYEITITGIEEQGYKGSVSGHFYVADKYSLNFVCSEISFGDDYGIDWRMHKRFYFGQDGIPEDPVVKAAGGRGEALIEGTQYTITYYERYGDGFDDNGEFNKNENPVGPPKSGGEYVARIQGKAPYYGGTEVMIDVGGLFLIENGSPYLWSDGSKTYNVNQSVEGDVNFKLGAGEWNDQGLFVWDDNRMLTDEDYSFADGRLTVSGKNALAKIGRDDELWIYAWVGDENNPDAHTYKSVGLRESEDRIDNKEEDREMILGDGGGISQNVHRYVRNEEHPDGYGQDCEVTSVEILEGVQFLNDDSCNIQKVTETVDGENKDRYYLEEEEEDLHYQIVDWTDDFDYENAQIVFRVNFRDIDGDESHYDFTVTIKEEVYEIQIESNDGRYEGLPGDEFGITAMAKHRYRTEDGEYKDDNEGLKYRWSYAIGSEMSDETNRNHEPADEEWQVISEEKPLTTHAFADFSVEGNTGCLAFKELTGNQNDDEFYVKAAIVDEEGNELKSFWDEWRCSKEYIDIEPTAIGDFEPGEELSKNFTVVRHYVDDNGDSQHVPIVDKDLTYRWDYYDDFASIKIDGEEVGDNEYYETNGDGLTFNIKRKGEWGSDIRLHAEWGDGDNRQDVERWYRFSERNYDINYDDHDFMLYTDVFRYNRVHKDDEGFEPAQTSNRLNIGDLLGEDWGDHYDLTIEAGHWDDENDCWKGGKADLTREYDAVDPKVIGDYTVTTGEDGNVYVALTERFINSIEQSDEGWDNIRFDANLYPKGSAQNDDTRLGSCDSWFHVSRPQEDFSCETERDMLAGWDGKVVRNFSINYRNTEYPEGLEKNYKVTGVRITDGKDLLDDTKTVITAGDYLSEESGWYYKIRDLNDKNFEYGTVKLEVTYIDPEEEVAEGKNPTEYHYELDLNIVYDIYETWMWSEGNRDQGFPGATFELYAGVSHKFYDEEGEYHDNGLDSLEDDGCWIDWDLEYDDRYAELVVDDEDPSHATLKFKSTTDLGAAWNAKEGIDVESRVNVRLLKDGDEDDGDGPIVLAEEGRNFWLRDHYTVFYPLELNSELEMYNSIDTVFELREYNFADDPTGETYRSWTDYEYNRFSFDEEVLSITYVNEDNEVVSVKNGVPVPTSDAKNFTITRLDGRGTNLRVEAVWHDEKGIECTDGRDYWFDDRDYMFGFDREDPSEDIFSDDENREFCLDMRDVDGIPGISYEVEVGIGYWDDKFWESDYEDADPYESLHKEKAFTNGVEYTWDVNNKNIITVDGAKAFEAAGGKTKELYFIVTAKRGDETIGTAITQETIRDVAVDYRRGDYEMLPGWYSAVSVYNDMFVENSAHPFGDDVGYVVKSVEVESGEDLLDESFLDHGEDNKIYLKEADDEDVPRFELKIKDPAEIHELGDVNFKVCYEMDDEDERDPGNGSFEFKVHVTRSLYEMSVESTDWNYIGLPGSDIDLEVTSLLHKFIDDNNEYQEIEEVDDTSFEWTKAWPEDEDLCDIDSNDGKTATVTLKAPEGEDEFRRDFGVGVRAYVMDGDEKVYLKYEEVGLAVTDNLEEEILWDKSSGYAYKMTNSDGLDIAVIRGHRDTDGTTTVLDIPEEIGGRTVRTLAINFDRPIEGDNTDYSKITEIRLPGSIIWLNTWRLRQLESLESITLNGTLWSQENDYWLTKQGVLYEKHTSKYTDINGNTITNNYVWLRAFPRNSKVETLTLPDGVTGLSLWSVAYAKHLKGVVLPESCIRMDDEDWDVDYEFEGRFDSFFDKFPGFGITFTADKAPEANNFLCLLGRIGDLDIHYPNSGVGYEEFLDELRYFGLAALPDEENIRTINVGETKTADGDDVVTYRFTVPEKGNYSVLINADENAYDLENVRAAVFTDNSRLECRKSCNSWTTYYRLRTNTVYYIQVQKKDNYQAEVDPTVTLVRYDPALGELPDDDQIEVLKKGVETTVDNAVNDKVYTFAIDSGGTSEIRFRATCNTENAHVEAVVFKGDNPAISNWISYGSASWDWAELGAGRYYVQCRMNGLPEGESGSFTVEYEREDEEDLYSEIPDNCKEIELNTKTLIEIDKDNSTATFAFTPETTGIYCFESFSDNEDTYGYVSNGEEVFSRDDTEYELCYTGNEMNFRVEFYGEAGKTYYLQCRYLSTRNTGDFIVAVHDSKGFDLEYADIDFVDESGDPISHVEDPTYSTDAFKAMFYVVKEGVSVSPLVSINGDTVDPSGYRARYSEVTFNEEAGEWQQIDENAWSNEFPTETGVYLCAIDGVGLNYGTRGWLDLIRVGQIELPEFYVKDGEGKRYDDGDTLSIQRGEKAFIQFAGGGKGYIIGWHDTIPSEDDPEKMTGDLSDLGFTVTQDTAEDHFGLWIDTADLPANVTEGSLTYTLHRYTGSIDWATDVPVASHTLNVEVTAPPQHVHEWGETTYVWASDNSSVKATRVCTKDETHVETETVAATSTVTTAPTCETAGVRTYTSAAFENEAFAVQTKTEPIAATGHEWGTATYVWTDDNSSVTATRVCANDKTHVETETVDTTSAVTKNPTCTAKGETTYTAEFENEAFATQTKTVENIEKEAHHWGAVSYSPTEEDFDPENDGQTVTATRTCSVCNEPESETKAMTVSTTAAGCTEPGRNTYTVEFDNEAFGKWTAVREVASAGHSWGEVTYEWSADNSSVTATRVCANDKTHVETETVDTTSAVTKNPTCTAKGETTYTAEFENEAFATQTKTLDNINALGHDIVHHDGLAATCTKAGYKAYDTCSRCDYTTYEEIAALGHNLEKHDAEAATCTKDGHEAYWTCSRCEKMFSDEDGNTVITEPAVIGKLGHDWGAVTYSPTEEGFDPENDVQTVTASRTCSRCKDVDSETKAMTVSTTAAGCTEPGRNTYTVEFDNEAFGKWTAVREVASAGHSWGEVTYEWSADNSSVTASRVCANDPTHVETETVDTTSAVTKDPTCEEKGEKTYTAAFTNEEFVTQTKIVYIPATGHEWGAASYEWADDNRSVTATRVCEKDGTHNQTELVSTTSEVTKAATCKETGTRTYTTRPFANEAFAEQTKDEVIPATGHRWGEASYEWAADNSKVTATRTCKNDPSHKETENITTAKTTVNASCTVAGSETYKAEFSNEAFEEQTRIITIPATGHDYRAVVTNPTCTAQGYTTHKCSRCNDEYVDSYTDALGHDWKVSYEWDRNYGSVTASRVCSNDPSHYEEETVSTTSKVTTPAGCETSGKITYSPVREFTNSAFTVKDKAVGTKTVEIPATGHNWKEPVYTWNRDLSGDIVSVTASRECKNDKLHKQTETVAVESSEVKKEASATETGLVEYTSKAFNNNAFEVQTTEEVLQPTYKDESGEDMDLDKIIKDAQDKVGDAGDNKDDAADLAGKAVVAAGNLTADDVADLTALNLVVEQAKDAVKSAEDAVKSAEEALKAAQAALAKAQELLNNLMPPVTAQDVVPKFFMNALGLKAAETPDRDAALAAVAAAKAAVASASLHKASANNALATAKTAQSKIEAVKAEAAQKILDSTNGTVTEEQKAEAALKAKEAAEKAANLAREAQNVADETQKLVASAQAAVNIATGDENLSDGVKEELQNGFGSAQDNANTVVVTTANNTAECEDSEAAIAKKAAVALANNAVKQAEAATSADRIAELAGKVDNAQTKAGEYKSLAETAMENADKAARSLSATDIRAANDSINEAKSAKTAAERADGNARTAISGFNETLDEASASVTAASGVEGFDYDEINTRLSAAGGKVASEKRRLDTAGIVKEAADNVLGKAEGSISDAEKAAEVVEMINGINQTNPNSSAVAAARKAYDSLSADAKELIDDDVLASLKKAEKTVSDKKKAADELKAWNGTQSSSIPAVKKAKFKAGKKKVTVSWTKPKKKKDLRKYDKVEVQVCATKAFDKAHTISQEFKKTKKSGTVKSAGNLKLQSKKKYYVRVRNVKGSGTTKTVSKWSGPKRVKIK